jgi:hypothetical protein
MHLMISGRNCMDKPPGVPVLACTHSRNRLVPVVDFTHGYALILFPIAILAVVSSSPLSLSHCHKMGGDEGRESLKDDSNGKQKGAMMHSHRTHVGSELTSIVKLTSHKADTLGASVHVVDTKNQPKASQNTSECANKLSEQRKRGRDCSPSGKALDEPDDPGSETAIPGGVHSIQE